jgi:LysM repeat protein
MTTATNSSSESGFVSGFLNYVRRVVITTSSNGDTKVNLNNVAIETFNNGVIGAGYGAAETVISQPVPPHTSVFTGAKIDFNPSNLRAANVIRGLGQALGCTMDVAEGIGNVSQGNNAAAVCNVASCVGGVGGGWTFEALGAASPIPGGAFIGATGGGFLGGKVAEYACKRYFDLPTGDQPAPTAEQPSDGTSSSTSNETVAVPKLSADLAQTAANVVRFRPSPDYSGDDGAYTVTRGQTLTSIAKANGVTVQELIEANPQITDPNSIRTGQTIRLPSTASGYTPAEAGSDSAPSNSAGLPNDAAQTQALTEALGNVQGDFNIITENSGRIAVVNQRTGEVTLINNDGSTSAQPLESYWQAAVVSYQAQVNAGIILSDDPVGLFDLSSGAGLISEGTGQGVMFDASGVVVVDALGNTLLKDSKTDTTIAVNLQTGEITTQNGDGERVPANTFADAVNQIELPSTGFEGITPDVVAPPVSEPNPNSFSNYLDRQGDQLTTAQQDALAAQIDRMGLGGDSDLSFYPLPGGGTLIANAAGDIVGEITRSDSGDLNIKGIGIDGDGKIVDVNTHIDKAGTDLTDAQYKEAQTQQVLSDISQGIGLFNALSNLQNWDQLSDLGKLSAVVGLYNSVDGLGAAFGGHGNNLPGDLGVAANWLGLVQGLQSGDAFMIASGINSVSNQALDGALNSAFGSSNIPYVSIALALHNFEDNPAQSIGTLVGMAIGGPIGGAIGGFIGGTLGGLFGGDDPPPPVGSVHFGWDANGNIQHTIDFNQSGGGDAANGVAASVQGMLEQMVQAINAKNPSTADDVAINPYCLPKVSFYGGAGGATMEVTLGNGQVASQQVNSPQFSEWLLSVVQETGGIAPAWQVQTLQMHAQQMREQGADEAQIAAVAGITNIYVAQEGDAATSVQGNAAESADFKSQSFGALVVHLHDDPNVQAAQSQLSELLRDIDSDGYFEKSQWVSATDAQGNPQGLLTLDANGDGLIETRDILNLGGNVGQTAVGAELASQNANLQRNNVEWLDANGDGIIDKRDPAFAAIKLWVDVNQDGTMQADEGQSLATLQITSINFETGKITYADGSTDALTATTLQGDTEGVRLTQIQKADADGVLHDLDAGDVLEHEGYQGKAQVTDASGTHWMAQRDQTYEQQAKRTGDWEGTAEQEAHRHGGGNVEGAPTETTATGATDLGAVQTQTNLSTQSTVTEGDARVVSDGPTQVPLSKINQQTTVLAGDARIKSNTTTINSTTTSSTTNNTSRPAETRIVFVPTGQTSVQNELLTVTDSLIASAQSSLFGVGVNTGIGVLTAVGLGAVQNAQAAEQQSTLESDLVNPGISTIPAPVSGSNTLSTTPSSASTVADAPSVTFRQVDLGMFNVPQVVQVPTSTTASQNTVTPEVTTAASIESTSSALMYATVIVSTPAQVTTTQTTASASDPSSISAASTVDTASSTLTLGYPQVQGETLLGSEDVVLRLTQSILLANDSTPNAMADPGRPALTITSVSQPLHGQVSLVNGEVIFAPDLNFHGTATFAYTVTDQYGVSSISSATLEISAVNDAPVAQDDSVSSDEDIGLIFTQAQLLANDTDVDVATDGQVLSISRVGQAQHGTVWLDAQGNLRFVPDVNYHGPAQFTYWVSDGLAADGAGAETPATVNLTIAAVNDMPVVTGETISTDEDTTLIISQAALLQNDSDVDVATDGQVLSITAVSNAQHGSVTLNADGTISFVPDANFFGTASFDYVVDDGNGGAVTTTALIALSSVNDAPEVTGETINSNEDEVLTIRASALLNNDNDVDNAHDDLTISRVQSGTGGVVSLNANGDVVFTPTANYNGSATFTYWVKDASGLESRAATTTVVLAAVNDAPSVQGEIVTGASEDAVFHIDKATLLANDHDVDDADSALSLGWVGNASGGSVSLDANGNVVFTPTANFNSNATFQYMVRDAAGLQSALVQAVIPVAAVNDVPVAVDDQFTTYRNSTLTIGFSQFTSNDMDADNDGLTVSAVRDHANGHVSIVNGQVQFVANTGFTGTASFDYLTDDGHGGQAWATAQIDVKTPPNEYPTVVLTGTNFFGTGGSGIDIATASWYLSDDSGVASFSLQDYRVWRPYQVPTYGYDNNGEWTQTTKMEWGWGNLSDVLTIFDNSGTGLHWDLRRWAGFTQLESTWLVTDNQGVSNIWHFNYNINLGVTANYMDHSGYYIPPVILDLNGDGVHFSSLQNSNVAFDANRDGINDKMAWAGNDDGVLVWDKDHNYQISDASEFSFQTLKAGAQTDLEGLQVLDTNGNGLLDAGDAKFAEFAVWQDANGNGVNDASEFKTLTELGIASINLRSDGQMRDAGTLLTNSGSGETDATVMGNATFTRTDGTTGLVADTMLAYEAGYATPTAAETSTQTLVSVSQPVESNTSASTTDESVHATTQAAIIAAADAQTAEIIRQALLFNQVCNTEVAIDSTPLGFIPIQPEVQLHDMLVTPQDGSHQLMQSA